MKNIITIMKKELLRVFKSKRMMISLLLPGVLIFVMYTFMGDAIMNQVTTDEERAKADTYIVHVVNLPNEFKEGIADAGYNFEYTDISAGEVLGARELLKSGDVDLVLVFDENFVAKSFAGGDKPALMAYYNPYEAKSDYAYNRVFLVALNIYKEAVIQARVGDIDYFSASVGFEFNENSANASMMAMLVPMLLLIFLFSGCIAVTPESIAGEKERGTIATLLATPTKRSEIAIGKILALSILALISGISSFLGLMLSLPKLIGSNASLFSIYSFGEIALLFFIILSTVLIIVGLMAVVSSFSKNVKEATMLVMPMMILGMVVGLLNMFISAPSSFLFFLIPFYNASAAIASVLSFEIVAVNLAVTVISNILYMVGLVFLLTKIFNSEKIMFSK